MEHNRKLEAAKKCKHQWQVFGFSYGRPEGVVSSMQPAEVDVVCLKCQMFSRVEVWRWGYYDKTGNFKTLQAPLD